MRLSIKGAINSGLRVAVGLAVMLSARRLSARLR